jgi:hypothetical protein
MKLSTILLILFCVSSIQAQSRLSFGISSSYLNSYRIITKYESSMYKDYRDSKEDYLAGFDIEAVIIFKLNGKFIFETGIGYSKNGYSSKEVRLIDPGFSPITSGFKSEFYRYSNSNCYIPFHLAYKSNKRLYYYLSIGPSVLMSISRNVEWILRKELGQSDGQTIYKRTNESEINKVTLMLDLGLGIGYRLTNRFNIILQPKFIYDLLGEENTDIRDNLYYINLFNNENKSTKEHLFSYGLSLKVTYDL